MSNGPVRLLAALENEEWNCPVCGTRLEPDDADFFMRPIASYTCGDCGEKARKSITAFWELFDIIDAGRHQQLMEEL